jgi:hypothetical protein
MKSTKNENGEELEEQALFSGQFLKVNEEQIGHESFQ